MVEDFSTAVTDFFTPVPSRRNMGSILFSAYSTDFLRGLGEVEGYRAK